MTDKFIVLKNGLVLTLDRRKQAGYYDIVIRGAKIFFVDYEKKFNEKEFKSKNPDAEIIDASGKIIMPGFFNSKAVSSYSLNKSFFKKCTYENINRWVSLKLADNFLSEIQAAELFRNLLRINYSQAVLRGEIFINESSLPIRKDFYDIYLRDHNWIRQYFNLTVFDYTILQNDNPERMFSMGFRIDEDINNYSFSSLKKYLNGNNVKLFIDSSLSQKAFDSIKKIFGKPLVNVLAENDLISGNTILYNPTHLNQVEMEIIVKKNPTLLICPSDYINLSENEIEYNEFLKPGLNIIAGTGFTGNDILSELKKFSGLFLQRPVSYEWLLETAITNPARVFGISNLTGSIERNKSADLISFDLNDLRNVMTLPELTSEDICEFIIENLTVKDISDVILKGEFLVRDKINLSDDQEELKQKAGEISSKIYAAGKYLEFKEKYLMRGRVDKMLLGTQEEEEEIKKEEIFVDMTETGEYTGEGEFTILGTKEEDYEKPWIRKTEEKEQQVNVKEIKSLEKDLNLFDEEYEHSKVRNLRKDIKKEKIIKKTSEEKLKINKDTEQKTEEPLEPAFNKDKLKFGFKEDEG